MEIARCRGVHYYDATGPNRLEEVLGELVTSFQDKEPTTMMAPIVE